MNDKEFAIWEKRVFGYGYGSGEEPILTSLKAFVSTILKEGRRYEYTALEAALGEPVTWLLINALCKSGDIEYGTSPRFGWFYNEELLAFIRTHSVDEMVAILEREDDSCAP